MVLQSEGRIMFSDFLTEFQKTPPILLSQLYGAATDIPSAGQLKLSLFYGKAMASAGIPWPLTLTSASKAGASGPTLTDLQASYATSWSSNAQLFTQYQAFQGYQQLALEPGTYTFSVYGASGARSATNRVGGNGALLTSTFTFPSATQIVAICGQAGTFTNTAGYGGSGGGCSCVVALDNGGSNVTPLMLAGGGAGGGQTTANAASSNLGGRLLDVPPTASVAGNSTYRPAGQPAFYNANGAGYAQSTVILTGSATTPSTRWTEGFQGAGNSAVTPGGFGGGGIGSTGSVGAGGGGGGWRGGNAGLRYTDGSGGTSYLNNTDARFQAGSSSHAAGNRDGNGMIVITKA